MDFQDVVRRRRMVRDFRPDPVDPRVVDRLLRNAVRAPSAGFTQGWEFVVLDLPDDVARFWRAATPSMTGDREGVEPERGVGDSAKPKPDRMARWRAGMRRAPVLIMVLTAQDAYLRRYAEPDKNRGDRNADWPVPYWHVDAGMAALLMLLTAVDEGLGACFFGVPGPRRPAVHAEFGIPDQYEITGVVAVGHPVDGATPGPVEAGGGASGPEVASVERPGPVTTSGGASGSASGGASGSASRRARRPMPDVVHRGGWTA